MKGMAMAVDKTKIAHERAKMSARSKVLNSKLVIQREKDRLKAAQDALKELNSLTRRKPV